MRAYKGFLLVISWFNISDTVRIRGVWFTKGLNAVSGLVDAERQKQLKIWRGHRGAKNTPRDPKVCGNEADPGEGEIKIPGVMRCSEVL